MPIVVALALAFAGFDGQPNAIVVEEAVLAAPRSDVERALMDVGRWPAVFRDIEEVQDVQVAQGVVRARVRSSATGLQHDVEVRRHGERILWLVDEGKGLVVFEIFDLDDKGARATHLTVSARAYLRGVIKVVLSDQAIEQKLRGVVQADVADLVRIFGDPRL